MREIGILYTEPNIRAIAEKRKGQTRRTSGLEEVNKEPDNWTFLGWSDKGEALFQFQVKAKLRYRVGDVLYVKEAWRCTGGGSERNIIYKLDGDSAMSFCGVNDGRTSILKVPEEHWVEWDRLVYETDLGCNWRSPLYMPKWAARPELKRRVTEVRVQRVQDISEEDAIAEGMDCGCVDCTPKKDFQKLWDSINSRPKPIRQKGVITHYVSYPWDDIHETREHRGKPWHVCGNPWAFCYSFEEL